MKMTQQERVIDYLKENGSITSMQAFNELGVTRISAVIFDLRQSGYDIESEQTKGVNRYGEKTYFATYKLKMNDDTRKEFNS